MVFHFPGRNTLRHGKMAALPGSKLTCSLQCWWRPFRQITYHICICVVVTLLDCGMIASVKEVCFACFFLVCHVAELQRMLSVNFHEFLDEKRNR